MSAWKRTTKKGKFKELARKKAFQKKGEPKENFTYPLAKKDSVGPKKENLFFEKVLK